MTRRCAFLTLHDPTGWFIDDDLACGPLEALGWRVETVPWDRPGVAWAAYDAVVIRSTWDYVGRAGEFVATLGAIARSGTRLFNSLDLVRWNLEKTYLRRLADRGVPVVPTLWRDRLAPGELARLLEETGADEAVLKPVVGAGGKDTFRLARATLAAAAPEVEAVFADRPLMLQPFVPSVVREGEYSVFYFDGAFSHAVLKTPSGGEFRVQEEHGGLIRAVTPSPALRAAGDAVLAALDEVPLYARADFVRATGGDAFWLMEVELVEPSLYLRTDPGAAARFAAALDARAR